MAIRRLNDVSAFSSRCLREGHLELNLNFLTALAHERRWYGNGQGPSDDCHVNNAYPIPAREPVLSIAPPLKQIRE